MTFSKSPVVSVSVSSASTITIVAPPATCSTCSTVVTTIHVFFVVATALRWLSFISISPIRFIHGIFIVRAAVSAFSSKPSCYRNLSSVFSFYFIELRIWAVVSRYNVPCSSYFSHSGDHLPCFANISKCICTITIPCKNRIPATGMNCYPVVPACILVTVFIFIFCLSLLHIF